MNGRTRASIGIVAALIAAALSGCGTFSKHEPSRPPVDAKPPPTSKGGGYYLDDGPGANPPPNLDSVPDAVPRMEALHRGAMRPYNVMGRNYTPMTALGPYKERGVASWYGRRYHGKQTSSGEIYDMYGMTAAHTTLPIPSYARVTSLTNGKSVVVRVNDRGPFIDSRVIDLSYTAAYKLGVLAGGSAMVEVESLMPGATPPPEPVLARPAIAAPPVAAEPRAAETLSPKPEPSSAPERRIPLEVASSGVYLQLGAFSTKENADAYATRLRADLAWLAAQLQVYTGEGFFRVHAGPFANQGEARAAADRISETLGMRPLVLVR